ncbi:GDP-Man:Man(3)GlcNAc(2)-PP-Dol alpha-1,2-mannosyltransferase [Dermacentor andersoni]|uniref:GDP-Man:Man(3)GlcNAc(2)-PP-Dol alpha-1,2-mannosyltransferase n=1 Tax=Dermacentor andersoni TaxID=34620 RepID=UPI0021558F39|nr:GDP-Man:Man(3)GlcNAc(2)-PP-Dol alpha-1,2-mannosyltransferase-like [Dermacentor andersoni]XP_050039005.1 GDP-Man:Man(3)GlcNAc(2)-PP-Dol alpha-1,2-mannosyltransferase-like [Dermacentor andersoni]
MAFLLVCFFILCLPLALPLLWLRIRTVKRTSRQRFGEAAQTWGFFHPYANACGGGEKVLWSAVRAIQEKYPSHQCIVYTGDHGVSGDQIIENAEKRFNVKLSKSAVHFVFLRSRSLVEARLYPVFTILGQSLGSVMLGLEAILTFVPTIFVDSTGYAFTMPIFKFFGGCKVMCYTHYPTISTDMLSSVERRVQAHNNRGLISRSAVLTPIKLLYYRTFAKLYAYCGWCADLVMVNSTWTKGHILELWQLPTRTVLVYPPCSVGEFKALPIMDKDSVSSAEFRVLSLSQFRPEKDHELQLKVLVELKEQLPDSEFSRIRFVMIGGCRNQEDEQRVTRLKHLAAEMGVEDNVEFRLNAPFADLMSEMKRASAAIHTMWNEHFGMCVVECMAAGLLMVAHNSGGPKMDIVTDYDNKRTGFLADSVSSYTAAFRTILEMAPDERRQTRETARLSSERFSDEVFSESFLSAVGPLTSKMN